MKSFILFITLVFTITCFATEYNKAAAETNARLGLAYLKKGMYPASKNSLLNAIKEDPAIAASWYSMAYYLEKTGDIKAAQEYYRKAISVAPHSGSAINNYGTYLCRTGQYSEAIQKFLKAAHEREYLNVAGSYENAGTCAMMMHNNTLALKYFHQAINNNPSMPFSLLSIARIDHLMGNDAAAEKYFTTFKDLILTNKPVTVVQKYRDYVFSGAQTKSLPLPA